MKKMTAIFFTIALFFSGCATFQTKRAIYHAKALIHSGGTRNLHQAEKILLGLAIKNNNNPQVHNLLGEIYYLEEKWDQARYEFETAKTLGINSYEPYFYEGMIYYRKGDFETARNYLEKAEEKMREENICNPEVYRIMGNIFETMNNYLGAIEYYKKALSCPLPNKTYLEQNIFKAEITEKLALIYEDLAKKAWERGYSNTSDNQAKIAEFYFKKAIELDPSDSAFYLNLAQLYHWMGRFKDAIRYYKEAANAAEQSGNANIQKEAYKNLGIIYEYFGEQFNNPELIKSALIAYSKLELLSPNLQKIKCKIGKLYWQLGNKDEAFNELAECCEGNSLYRSNVVQSNSTVCTNIYSQLKKERESRIINIALRPMTSKGNIQQPQFTTQKNINEVQASITQAEQPTQPTSPPQKTENHPSKEIVNPPPVPPAQIEMVKPSPVKPQNIQPVVSPQEKALSGPRPSPSRPLTNINKGTIKPTPVINPTENKPLSNTERKSVEKNETIAMVTTQKSISKKLSNSHEQPPTPQVKQPIMKNKAERQQKGAQLPPLKQSHKSQPIRQNKQEKVKEKQNTVPLQQANNRKQPNILAMQKKNSLRKTSTQQKEKSSFSITGVASDADLGLADLDQILSHQGKNVATNNVVIPGMRRKGSIGSVDVALNIQSGKTLSIKKKMKKIQSQLQLSNKQETGHLDPKIIARVIASHYGEVRYCYEKQLKINPSLEGRLEVKFTIGKDGSIDNAAIVDSTLNNIEVESCVLYKVKRWMFPKPRGGKVTVIFPFIFMGGT